MLFKPLLGTDLSGKAGGLVASHNAGGAYFRAATIPTNPNTTFQQAVRNAVAQLTSLWIDSLTQTQRDEWQLYADNVPLTNRIGEQHNISGLSMYVRSNTSRLQTGITRVDDGPPVFDLGAYSPPTLSGFSEATQLGDVNFSAGPLSDPWANEVGGFMLVYISRPQNPGVKYFRGPYRVQTTVVGDPVPPVSPQNFGSPFPITAGQRLFGRAVTLRADGRYSASSFFTTLVGA